MDCQVAVIAVFIVDGEQGVGDSSSQVSEIRSLVDSRQRASRCEASSNTT